MFNLFYFLFVNDLFLFLLCYTHTHYLKYKWINVFIWLRNLNKVVYKKPKKPYLLLIAELNFLTSHWGGKKKGNISFSSFSMFFYLTFFFFFTRMIRLTLNNNLCLDYKAKITYCSWVLTFNIDVDNYCLNHL